MLFQWKTETSNAVSADTMLTRSSPALIFPLRGADIFRTDTTSSKTLRIRKWEGTSRRDSNVGSPRIKEISEPTGSSSKITTRQSKNVEMVMQVASIGAHGTFRLSGHLWAEVARPTRRVRERQIVVGFPQ